MPAPKLVVSSPAAGSRSARARHSLIVGVSLLALPTAFAVVSPACAPEGEVASQQSLANGGVAATLVVQSDWGAGYCANVNLSNGASVATRTWSVGLALKGSAITQAWNASLAQAGDTVTFTPVSWNAALNSGSTTSFGFCASRTSGKDVPVLLSVTVDGVGMTGGNGGIGGNGNGSLGTGGVAATGGSTAGTGGMLSGTGGRATGGVANGGSASGGRAMGGSTGGLLLGGSRGGAGGRAGASATGGAATGGAATGGAATGGAATGGTANSGTGGRATGGTTASGGTGGTGGLSAGGGRTAEDDGADCVVGTLPDAASLSTNAKLPDPFKKLDGTRIASKADWRCRREEIKRMAEKYAFGTKPPRPQSVTGTVASNTLTVRITDNGKSTSFSASIQLPTTGTAPYPAIIVYGGNSFGAPLDNAVINSEGVALINYDPYAVGKETGARSPKQGAFYDIAGSNSKTGLLVAWGWGVSRILDVLEQDGKVIKADAVGVTGCSRFGKGSFLAGVFDQRIALTLPIESGTAGVPLWRGVNAEGGQTLASAYGEQPWFGDDFSPFTGSPTRAPLDTHELVAMVAPRGLFIMDNPHIANLGPKSAHAAALAGAEVYKALGAASNITYDSDIQNGNHCSLRPEWSAPLRDNIEKFLKRTGNAAGAIKASAKATAKLSDWVDWSTPTLN